MSILYPSSLSDAEWDRLQEVLPCSRLRWHTLRSIFDAVFYVLRTGCPWRYLPCNFPLWQTVYYHFKQFCRTGLWTRLYRALRDAERRRVGKDPDPSAPIIDAHTWIKGRKRHLLVDTLGLPLSVSVSPVDMHDTQGARRLLAGLKYVVPRLKKIWADAAYRGQELADWCKAVGDWEFALVQRTSPGVRGFAVQPKRWVVEHTCSWLSHGSRGIAAWAKTTSATSRRAKPSSRSP